MKKKLQANIYKNYLYTFIANFSLTNGVWMLYLAYRGLSLFEIGIMEAIFHMTSFTMEVPTGMVADIYGRKTSRILGRAFAVMGTLIMIFSNHMVFFAISFMFSALSYNLESGAGDALIYDSLKELEQEQHYMRVNGRKEIFYQLAGTASLLLGGYLATLDYLLVYKVSLIIGLVTLLQTFSFTEPNHGRVDQSRGILVTFKDQLKLSVKAIHGDKRVLFLIVSLELFSLFYTTEFFYIQNFLKAQGKSEFTIGLTLALGALLAAISASNIHKLDKKVGPKNLLKILPLMGIVGFILVAIKGLTAYGFIYLALVEGAMFVSYGDYINRLIPSEQRATIISFQSMLFSILMIVLFPIAGMIGDYFTLQTSFVIIGILATITLLVIFLRVLYSKELFQDL